MGACNGYRYHDLRPRDDYARAHDLCRISVRDEAEARKALAADDVMLLEIAAKPEDQGAD